MGNSYSILNMISVPSRRSRTLEKNFRNFKYELIFIFAFLTYDGLYLQWKWDKYNDLLSERSSSDSNELYHRFVSLYHI